MRTRAAIVCVVVISLLVPAAVPALAGSPGQLRDAFTTKTPYRPQQPTSSYQRAPAGFAPVFTENVSRHGSRTLSDGDDADALLALWNIARSEDSLTTAGESLGAQVERVRDTNAAIGYGLLTPDGVRELESTAARLVHRLPTLFRSVARQGDGTQIDVVASSQARTVQSANAFVAGLEAKDPALSGHVGTLHTDDDLLYFHKAAVNKDYQDYVANDPRVAAAESAARDSAHTRQVATDVLLRSFTPGFVRRIAAGDYAAQFGDEVAAAEAVYDLYAVTQDLAAEGPWQMSRYISVDQTRWFGYLDDLTSFYENGPGFTGDDITYRMAAVLLDDMFASLDAKVAGTSPLAAELRFTHAEEIFPLAALLQLPGSTRQQPVGTPYTDADNPFRGAQVAPMGANVQWDLFRSGDTYLVRMLYNEKETAFKAACRPVSKGSYFYELSALERCYGVA